MSTSVRYDDATLADIQRRFREGRPKETAKRKRHSRCSLIASLRTEIEQLLNEGYSLEGIAEYFAALDVPIPAATLKNYLGRARRAPSGTQGLSARDTQGDARPVSELGPRKSRGRASDGGTNKKAPRSGRASTEKDPAAERGRERARDGRSTDRGALAQSPATSAHDRQSGSGDVEGTPANCDVNVDAIAVGISVDALGDTCGVQTTNPTPPEAGQGATRPDGEAARDGRADGHAAVPTAAGTADAAASAPAASAAREPTLTPTKVGTRPSAHALAVGNIGFVPRR